MSSLVERLAAAARGVLSTLYSTDDLLGERECLGCSQTATVPLAVSHADGCEVAEVEAALDQYVEETGVHA